MTDPLWTPPVLTEEDHAFIGAAVGSGNIYIHPDTMLELRRRLSDYNRFERALPEHTPIDFGVRIYVDGLRERGRVHGPAGTSMSLDTFLPIITPVPHG